MSDLSNYQRQDAYETTLSQDISSSATSINVTTAPSFTLSSGGCYGVIDSDNSSKIEPVLITGISGNTLTVTRGIAKYEGGSSTAASHSAGAKFKISNNWKVFDDIKTAINSKADNTGDTFTGMINFSGTTHSGVRLISLTTAERTALTAANGDLVYDTDIGEIYQYIGGAWSAVSSGSTQPNSSTTVAGKSEAATQSEWNAGTTTGGTGALLFPTADLDGQSEVQYLNGVLGVTETSAGAGDADKLVDLNASGKFDNSVINTGVSNGQIPVMDATGYPAADGSQITNVSSNFAITQNTRTVAAGSGTQDYTSAGWQPSMVIIKANFNTAGLDMFSDGFSNGTTNYCHYQALATEEIRFQSTQCIRLESTSGNSFTATISMLSNGFRITWTMTGTPAATAQWFAIAIK